MYQIWFDDVASLLGKMERLAVDHRLGGIGFWWASCVDYLDETCARDHLGRYWQLMQSTYLELERQASLVEVYDRL